jgi:predicted phage-related endonuclease
MSNKRMIARSGTEEWYKAREYGVSATTVAKAASGPGGYNSELERALHPEANVIEDNAYMKFGRDWEQWIVEALPESYGITANDWLIAAAEQERHLATPDGLNADWSIIAEVKTTGKDWDGSTIPIQYRRQVQWQMYVTGATKCVFAWLLRVEDDNGVFAPAWLEPKVVIIDRDEDMIADLIDVAHRFVTDFNNYKELEHIVLVRRDK